MQKTFSSFILFCSLFNCLEKIFRQCSGFILIIWKQSQLYSQDDISKILISGISWQILQSNLYLEEFIVNIKK